MRSLLKTPFSLLGALFTTLLSPWCAAKDHASQSHLFILSGQSNMTGALENGFSDVVARALGENHVTVVRHCKPGRGIRFWVKDYALPETHEFHGKLTGGNGEEFPKLLEIARSAGDATKFATVTFVWMQGESDANRNLACAYQRSFTTLMTQLKTEIGIDKMHFVIARISDYGLQRKNAAGWKLMREVQQNIADADPLGTWVDTDDLNGGNEQNPHGELHYPSDQYPILGARLATAALKLLALDSKHGQ